MGLIILAGFLFLSSGGFTAGTVCLVSFFSPGLLALRVLVSSDDEWDAAGRSIGNFSIERNSDNEYCSRLVARTAIELELSSKPTTIEEDIALLQQMDTATMSRRLMVDASTEKRLALQFRIEKKRLLQETIELLK